MHYMMLYVGVTSIDKTSTVMLSEVWRYLTKRKMKVLSFVIIISFISCLLEYTWCNLLTTSWTASFDRSKDWGNGEVGDSWVGQFDWKKTCFYIDWWSYQGMPIIINPAPNWQFNLMWKILNLNYIEVL